MRVANLITTYKNPAQNERLIRSMKHGQFDFYIHLDGNVDISDFKFLSKLDGVSIIRNRMKVVWGGYSFTKAILNSIEEIIATGIKYDFINLMSSQDYPIKPVSYIYECLEQRKGHCFLAYFGEDDEAWWKTATPRIRSYNLNDFDFRGKYVVQRMLNSILPQRNFPLPVKLYGSSCATWWTLSMECAQYLVDYIKKDIKLANFMKFTWGADEFLIPTLVMNSPFSSKTLNDNLRHIDWSLGGSNPKIFRSKDFDVLRQSDKLFARKFDTLIDSEVLNRIDREILNPIPIKLKAR